MGKPPHTTLVVIDEVELDNWGVGGVTMHEWREQQRTAATGETK
ncbi:tautomerase family protein [Burkholderia plantarii]